MFNRETKKLFFFQIQKIKFWLSFWNFHWEIWLESKFRQRNIKVYAIYIEISEVPAIISLLSLCKLNLVVKVS